MTNDTNPNHESAIIPVGDDSTAIVEREMPDASDEVKQRMVELIRAIKRRAQTELQTTGGSTHDAYLRAVRQAEEALAKTQGASERYRDDLERSLRIIEQEAQANWGNLVQEVTEFGDRLRHAVDAAWSVMTAPKPPSSTPPQGPNHIEIEDE